MFVLAIVISSLGFGIFLYGLISYAIREQSHAEMSAFVGLVVLFFGFLIGGVNLRHPEFVHKDLPLVSHLLHWKPVVSPATIPKRSN